MAQKEKVKRVLFVNKFGPTGNAITGQTAKQLASFLNEERCEVCFLCIGAIYRSNDKKKTPDVPYRVRAIRDFYNGDSSFLRLIMSFVDGFRLFVASLRIKADVVIVMTEPPLLFFWFQLFSGLSKRKLFYWTMDIYPDAFAAASFISVKNIFYRFFKKIVYRKPPDLLIALGDEQRKFLEMNFKAPVKHAIIPCGLVEKKTLQNIATVNDTGKVIFGYGGNMGAAHDAKFLIELIRQLDPEKHLIILNLYGTKAQEVRDAIANHKSIQEKDFLSHTDIATIDINIASLLDEWDHISVPSKAVTAISCGSTLLLNASKATDAWQMFEKASWIIEPASEYKLSIEKFLSELTPDAIWEKKSHTMAIASHWAEERDRSYKKVLAAIQLS